MLLAIVDDRSTVPVMDAAREAGAVGATLVQEARGQGRKGRQAMMGLDLEGGRDLILFLVPLDRSSFILETVSETAEFDSTSGTGLICQVDIEDSIGLRHQHLETTAPSDPPETKR